MTKKKIIIALLITALAVCFFGCGKNQAGAEPASEGASPSAAEPASEGASPSAAEPASEAASSSAAEPASAAEPTSEAADTGEQDEASGKALQLKIADTVVEVEWEDNESVEALKELCKEGPLKIRMSMYGGFEQVGPIGTSLPSSDEQMTTSAGDIVLYSSDQIVVFYGSNSWDYTKLGHIKDQNEAGMKDLLENGDVTITISFQ